MFNSLDLFWGWIGAIVVMSVAETILFPTMNVHIDRLAPDHLRGAYFGAASFYDLGFALAPLCARAPWRRYYIGSFWRSVAVFDWRRTLSIGDLSVQYFR